MGWVEGVDPIVTHWEPRWTAPTIEVTCPTCGLRTGRRAWNWSGTVDGRVGRATIGCDPRLGWGVVKTCNQTFEVHDVEVAVDA